MRPPFTKPLAPPEPEVEVIEEIGLALQAPEAAAVRPLDGSFCRRCGLFGALRPGNRRPERAGL